jgi:HD-GYP domain-containing protein (c-di-GMP phosphodiesterase class II)
MLSQNQDAKLVQTIQSLQRTNIELSLAYDATVEGFVRALEMREREPLGHTRQVAEVTARLAKAAGIQEPEIPHVRRGAFLHDIGKLGIPESILHKTEPLTDDEWTVIRSHPQISYDLLSPIVYLHPALDIPYCHHEKWDGTGYPHGMKGTDIPLTARIFAVIDVWDALISERPFRDAWPEEKASEYIREQAGLRFDPDIVDIFLDADIKRRVTHFLVR